MCCDVPKSWILHVEYQTVPCPSPKQLMAQPYEQEGWVPGTPAKVVRVATEAEDAHREDTMAISLADSSFDNRECALAAVGTLWTR